MSLLPLVPRVSPTAALWSLGMATISPTTISLASLPSFPVMSLKALMRSSSPFETLKMFWSLERAPERTFRKESLPT